jgi:hypothetical protein
MQPAPGELPKPAASPIIPPLATPHQAPSWKTEQHGNAADALTRSSTPAGEANEKESKEQ